MRNDHARDRDHTSGATERRIQAGFAIALGCLAVIAVASWKHSSAITKATIIGGGVLALVAVGLALGAIRRDFAGRRRADQALRAANETLEQRFRERTADLEHAHESLLQNEKRFRDYVNATADVIYRMSPDWSEMRQLQGQEFLADTSD